MSYKNAVKLIGSVRSAGITVPPDVVKAETLAKVRPVTRTAADAEKKLRAAKSQTEMDSAALEYANALSLATTVGSDEYRRAVGGARESILIDALSPVVPDLLDAVITKFNTSVDPFVDAIQRIPQGVETMSPLEIPRDVVDALTDARDAVGPLGALWKAYQETIGYLGMPPFSNRTGPGASLIVATLGTGFTNTDDVDTHWDAVDAVYRWGARSDAELPQLYPFLPVVRAGARLDLVTPAEAQGRLIVVQDQPSRQGIAFF